MTTPDTRREPLNATQARSLRVMRVLQRYHRHRVIGLENIPREGPAIIAINHSLASYDAGLLGTAIWDQVGRRIRPLGDRAIFRTPLLRTYADQIGVVEGSPATAERLLAEGEVLIVAPGGMRESLRPTRQRYQLMWERRKGFIRLAARAGVPLVLAACPRADDIYRVYENPWTKFIYQRLKMPAPIARGVGWTAIPHPVPLTHWLSQPIAPPASQSPADIDAAHASVIQVMEGLMERGVKSLF